MGRDGEIVGLASGESDRACESHEICGHHVTVGDLVKFKVVVLEEEGGWRPRSRQSRSGMELRAVTLAFCLDTLFMGAKRSRLQTNLAKCWSCTKTAMT
jgi:hypothetical protein